MAGDPRNFLNSMICVNLCNLSAAKLRHVPCHRHHCYPCWVTFEFLPLSLFLKCQAGPYHPAPRGPPCTLDAGSPQPRKKILVKSFEKSLAQSVFCLSFPRCPIVVQGCLLASRRRNHSHSHSQVCLGWSMPGTCQFWCHQFINRNIYVLNLVGFPVSVTSQDGLVCNSKCIYRCADRLLQSAERVWMHTKRGFWLVMILRVICLDSMM